MQQFWVTDGFLPCGRITNPKNITHLVILKCYCNWKLNIQMEQRKIISDETWKLNVDGPIRTNNEYDGEEYDATKEFTGWNTSGFNDAKWMKPNW